MSIIRKAILPVAGLGTRFLPATKAQPKEMLPIFDTPAIQFIVEEAVHAGIKEIIIVTREEKGAIENHFERNLKLESSLRQRGKTRALEIVRHIWQMAHFTFVRQEEALGDGHAILCAKDFINPDEAVAVLFGDDIVDNPNGQNAIEQLLSVYEKVNSPVVLLEKIAPQDVQKYGIVEMAKDHQITNIVEKPEPKDAPSNIGVVGKFILTPQLFKLLRKTMPGADKEIHLVNTCRDFIKSGGKMYGKILEGRRFDTGDRLGFLKATLYFALKKENGKVKEILEDFLKRE